MIEYLLAAHLALTGPAYPPRAFTQFCAAHPAQCARPVEHSADRLAELGAVDRAVNKIPGCQEPPGVDIWIAEPAKCADCDDYVATKQRRLMALGWPLSSLLMTKVRVRGVAHMVLIACTRKACYVLDNLRRFRGVTPLSKAKRRYTWLKMQSGPGRWSKVDVR